MHHIGEKEGMSNIFCFWAGFVVCVTDLESRLEEEESLREGEAGLEKRVVATKDLGDKERDGNQIREAKKDTD